MERGASIVPALAAALLLLAAPVPRARAGDRIAVVVHPDREAELAPDDLAPIFLKKRRFWGDGSPILPVNRDASSEVRAAFTAAVFGDRASRLAVYWNRQYFQGVLPPSTLASDEAVLRFVRDEPRALGYVRAGAVDATVKVLLYLD